MFVRIWRYRAHPDKLEAFERAYGPDGDWARLFGKADGFLGTELLRGEGGAYATIDRWRGESDWKAFLERYGEEYRALDTSLESLTLGEEDLGDWLGG